MVRRNDEALVQARKALQLHPGHAKTRYVLGQILLQLGRSEEAEFHLRKAAPEISSARKLLAKYFNPEARAR
jgi:Flp pilus assembly protein TadD